MIKTAAIVLAAGQGKRMQSAVAKQFLLLNNEPVVCHSLRAFEESEVETI
ncbi:MAG: 2-C-methyl-D-erythritol 4-phosphate cytidylyltransferase, partial [Lachnospiraceae bacterium]|nr:2-C-methyl-D-erythritol 4-phosphate cytidylyltransferase [Lachnospiraceae bacterium]